MTPPRGFCPSCGEKFRRAMDELAHRCDPNDTGFNPRDRVLVGAVEGVVTRVSRQAVEVYFRSSFTTQWYPASSCERLP